MADKRMFTRKVTDDDNFVGLSSSAQALYLHLSMSADDDGFSNQVAVSMFRAHASVQDLQALLEHRYVYQFENGVIVIKHWRMANALRKDRYTPTVFADELAQLQVDEHGSYDWLPSGCQVVSKRLPQDRLGKDIKETSSKEDAKKSRAFRPPTLEEVQLRCEKMGYKDVDPVAFISHYESVGWKVGKNKMVSWESALAGWDAREKRRVDTKRTTNAALKYKQTTISEDAFEALVVDFGDSDEEETD